MTTDTDKLEEMLRASGAEEAVKGLFYVTEKHAAAFRTAIIASLCGDVEPVAWQKADRQETEDGWAIVGWLPCTKQEFNALLIPQRALCDASTVAALKAENEALRKDAERYRWLRDGELTADYPYPVMRMGGSRVDDQTIWNDELDAAIDAALTKGQP